MNTYQRSDLGAQASRRELGASLQSSGSTGVFLDPSQIDLVAKACMVAVDESARFLCGRVRQRNRAPRRRRRRPAAPGPSS